MSRFKDAVANDIKAVFINGLEFAELHDINGCEMLAVIDGDIIQERNQRSYSQYAEGVFRSQIVVFVAYADLGYRPVNSAEIELDGKLYIVDDCAEEMGVLQITLGANDR